jgi:hypothetical protein
MTFSVVTVDIHGNSAITEKTACSWYNKHGGRYRVKTLSVYCVQETDNNTDISAYLKKGFP